MMRIWLLALGLLVQVGLASAADIAVVQQAARTTTGTQDFTSAGFGTPKAAMCLVGFGATSGTSVSHGGFAIGFTDGTNQNVTSARTKNGVTTTVAGRRSDTTDVLLLADQDATVILRAQFSSWITDGVRLNYSVAPGTAYQVSCTLFGGSGISQAYVNTVSTPSTVDTSTTVSSVGFQPDVILGAISGGTGYTDVNQAQLEISVGAAVRGVGQRGVSWFDTDNVTTTAQSVFPLTNRIGRNSNNASQIEIQNYTSTGFDATLRQATGFVATMGYLAIQLNGVTATVMEVTSPTATGSQSIASIGLTPQWGLLVMTADQTSGSVDTSGDAEVWGVSSFTAAAQSCVAMSADDNVGTSSTTSLTDTKPVCLRKDGALFYSASFTSFGSGTATFNYGTANGTARKWVGLFISESAGAAAVRRRAS
ncbi:MAG: hypothetical protein JSR31_05895 [Nitrospira sp.]|nr:hypothetical protein [Nitrospira sp.]